ncbi:MULTISPECIES: type IV pilus modification protein PilV [Xanthomonas]|uniref:type IV pilus modification protein PilV n=1 Tax=Xanthomonas TaxID=338 RepID=UPI001C46008E|nr:type IV pilus modification protein PilV [Xanthomonas euvesicatoria]MBV6845529.1 type IV pilus modification protein PilV [Xanthomonas campestris pv. paulliniae]MCP3039047.1 type IV pilus modification protein PilV [Xanthomonas euvesicatoria pv. allii]MCP3044088.1 type IV pilus modification protein PilV [Xanthomonas euvesicatoria pv. allii]MCP3051184.1 type IV pilus modification protein PilV [Xanthomonas euvesicatoria pv. allii]MDH4908540.1 type IV pilus modification protein PilV [Xanthomonas 
MIKRNRQAFSPRKISGFSLLEVLIALLILGVGLLGFALLQTTNVRFTKSAQQRTIASNLAYEVIDLMRSQRSMVGYYTAITYDSFGSVTGANCGRPVDSSPNKLMERWRCDVVEALPDGKAQVSLQANGEVTVTVRWGDQHWETDVAKQVTALSVTSRL